MSSDFNWKKPFKIILKILLVLIIILSLAVVTLAGTFLFMRWQRDAQEKESGDQNFLEQILAPTKKELEPKFTCLFLGVNGGLTDFIMLGQYDPNTREIALVSIPRDSNVGSASVDGKINSLYSSRGKNIEKVKDKVTEITGINVDRYVLFDTKILRKVVDEIGGVTVDVPINMNYDDPYQDLYIHLKKGVQTLNGKQAEQFCRFRKNNDGTGYPGGDIERTKAQQQFIKAFINELLKASNISKLNNLINIIVDGTKTDMTFDIAKEYIDDLVALRTDRIATNTLPGSARMGASPLGYNTSYYYLDKKAVKEMIDEMFNGVKKESGDKLVDVSSNDVETKKTYNNETQKSTNSQKPTNTTSSQKSSADAIRVELLNAGTTASVINRLVDKLKEKNFYVVKIGNYDTTRIETSRIIDYGTGSTSDLNKLKGIVDLSKVEDVPGKSSVDYTIILGPNYK